MELIACRQLFTGKGSYAFPTPSHARSAPMLIELLDTTCNGNVLFNEELLAWEGRCMRCKVGGLRVYAKVWVEIDNEI